MLRVIDDPPAPGPLNMARDEALLTCFDRPALRLYGWQPPCLSLGLFQDYEQVQAQAPAGLPMVRRITGGGSIYHINELTYAVVGKLGENGFPDRLRDAYPLFHGQILQQLRIHGATLMRQPETVGDRRYHQEVRCFASPAADDLVNEDGSKALGSAGRNRDGHFLIHGSLKLATNPWDQDAVVGCGVPLATAKECLIASIAAITGLRPISGTYTDDEEKACVAIHHVRYGDDQWLRHRRGPRP